MQTTKQHLMNMRAIEPVPTLQRQGDLLHHLLGPEGHEGDTPPQVAEQISYDTQTMVKTLEEVEFLMNRKKIYFFPSQWLKHLGLLLDRVRNMVALFLDRQVKMQILLSQILEVKPHDVVSLLTHLCKEADCDPQD